MRLHHTLIYICALPVLLTLTMCGRSHSDRPVLAVSIEPQRRLLEQIVGDHYDIITVMPSGSDPESYEPTMSTRAAIDRSEAYFTMDAMPFENSLKFSVDSDVEIIPVTGRIKPIYGTHAHGHNHFTGDDHAEEKVPDPHYWVSVRNMRSMAGVMAEEIRRIDPENAEEYNRNFLALDNKLDSIDRAYARRLGQQPGTTFLVWHPSLSYFSRDYGLRQLVVCDDNKDVSIATLRQVMQEATSDNIKVFFCQRYCNDSQAQTIVDGTGTRRVDINLTNYDWEKELNTIVDELTRL